MQIDLHPSLNDFDPLSDEEVAKLRKSIRKNGCKVPLLLWKPKEWLTDVYNLMDGRHRYRICQEEGVPYNVIVFDGTEKEAIALAKSLNEDRRHRPYGARALDAAKDASQESEETTTTPPIGGVGKPPKKRTAGTSATRHKVSKRAVERAKVIIEGGTKKLIKAVETDAVSLSDAEKVAKLPDKVQNKAVNAVKKKEAATLAEFCWPTCERCKETGRVEGCTACADMHQCVLDGKKYKPRPAVLTDGRGHEVPTWLVPVFESRELYDTAMKQMNALAKTWKEIEECPAKEAKPLDPAHKHFEKFAAVFKNARWRMRNMKPEAVCEKCGAEGCKACRELGWLTVEMANEACPI